MKYIFVYRQFNSSARGAALGFKATTFAPASGCECMLLSLFAHLHAPTDENAAFFLLNVGIFLLLAQCEPTTFHSPRLVQRNGLRQATSCTPLLQLLSSVLWIALQAYLQRSVPRVASEPRFASLLPIQRTLLALSRASPPVPAALRLPSLEQPEPVRVERYVQLSPLPRANLYTFRQLVRLSVLESRCWQPEAFPFLHGSKRPLCAFFSALLSFVQATHRVSI